MSFTKKAVFSPVHDWLVVAHQGVLTFWSLSEPRARVLTGHAQSVSRLVFTPDSQGLLSCGVDDVRLWPLGPGRGGVRRIVADYQGQCIDAALAPDGERVVLVGSNGARLAPFEGRGRWLADGASDFPHLFSAAAWDASGRRIAVASSYTASSHGDEIAAFVFDLEAGTERRLPLAPPGESGQGYDWGVYRLAFTPQGRLLAGGSGGVRWLDTDAGTSDWIWRLPKESNAWIAASGDGRRVVATALQRDGKAASQGVVRIDLPAGAVQPVHSHGRAVTAAALDTAGRTLVTGDEEGVVRVGAWEGGEPHRLCCHAGAVGTISVSPDGKWIASASGGEIRLWPMPDLSKPPLHTLPYDELMAKLRALTNLQVVADPASAAGYRLDVGPFPGWKDVPSW
jgi:WD40 repeat protein